MVGQELDKLKHKSMDYIVFFSAYFISIKAFSAFVLNAKTEKSLFTDGAFGGGGVGG